MTAFKNYKIDGWSVELPLDWTYEIDKSQAHPQIIFTSPDRQINIYLSTWRFSRPETQELASPEIIGDMFKTGVKQRGLEPVAEYAAYYPAGCQTYAAQSGADKAKAILAFALCLEGRMLTVYFAAPSLEIIKPHLTYLKLITIV